MTGTRGIGNRPDMDGRAGRVPSRTALAEATDQPRPVIARDPAESPRESARAGRGGAPSVRPSVDLDRPERAVASASSGRVELPAMMRSRTPLLLWSSLPGCPPPAAAQTDAAEPRRPAAAGRRRQGRGRRHPGRRAPDPRRPGRGCARSRRRPSRRPSAASCSPQSSASSACTNVRIDKVGNVLGELPGRAARGRTWCSPRTSTRCSPRAPTSKSKQRGHGHARPGHRRRLPRPGGGAGRRAHDGEEAASDAGHHHLRRQRRRRGPRRPARREAPVQRGPEGAHRPLRLDRRHRPRHHQRRGRQPALPRDVQGPGRPQLRRVRHGQPDPRARPRHRDDLRTSRCPREPKTTFNVGRIGGGTSVNSIPFEAWMEVDMRSADAASLQALDAKFHKAVDDAVRGENARWGKRVADRGQGAGRATDRRARRRATRRSCRRPCR